MNQARTKEGDDMTRAFAIDVLHGFAFSALVGAVLVLAEAAR